MSSWNPMTDSKSIFEENNNKNSQNNKTTHKVMSDSDVTSLLVSLRCGSNNNIINDNDNSINKLSPIPSLQASPQQTQQVNNNNNNTKNIDDFSICRTRSPSQGSSSSSANEEISVFDDNNSNNQQQQQNSSMNNNNNNNNNQGSGGALLSTSPIPPLAPTPFQHQGGGLPSSSSSLSLFNIATTTNSNNNNYNNIKKCSVPSSGIPSSASSCCGACATTNNTPNATPPLRPSTFIHTGINNNNSIITSSNNNNIMKPLAKEAANARAFVPRTGTNSTTTTLSTFASSSLPSSSYSPGSGVFFPSPTEVQELNEEHFISKVANQRYNLHSLLPEVAGLLTVPFVTQELYDKMTKEKFAAAASSSSSSATSSITTEHEHVHHEQANGNTVKLFFGQGPLVPNEQVYRLLCMSIAGVNPLSVKILDPPPPPKHVSNPKILTKPPLVLVEVAEKDAQKVIASIHKRVIFDQASFHFAVTKDQVRLLYNYSKMLSLNPTARFQHRPYTAVTVTRASPKSHPKGAPPLYDNEYNPLCPCEKCEKTFESTIVKKKDPTTSSNFLYDEYLTEKYAFNKEENPHPLFFLRTHAFVDKSELVSETKQKLYSDVSDIWIRKCNENARQKWFQYRDMDVPSENSFCKHQMPMNMMMNTVNGTSNNSTPSRSNSGMMMTYQSSSSSSSSLPPPPPPPSSSGGYNNHHHHHHQHHQQRYPFAVVNSNNTNDNNSNNNSSMTMTAPPPPPPPPPPPHYQNGGGKSMMMMNQYQQQQQQNFGF